MGLLGKLLGRAPATPRAAASEAAPARGTLLDEAMALAGASRYGDALDRVDAAERDGGEDADSALTRASVLQDWGRTREAVAQSLRAAALGARGPQADFALGWARLRAGDGAGAEACLRRALAAGGDAMQAHFALGIALHAQRRLAEAIAAFAYVLERDPQHFDTLVHAGNCELERPDPVAAESLFRRAVAAAPQRANAWNDLSVALHRQDRHDEAVAASRAAVAAEDAAGVASEAFVNLAIGLTEEGRLDEALDLYARRLDAHPAPSGHYGYGLSLLTAGRLAEGWPHAEFRWMVEPLVGKRAASTRPVWSGEPLAGRTLLLRAEQGIGDTIQFLRYAPAIKALGATVLLRVQDGFEAFARGFPGIDRVLDASGPAVEFDYYVHPMSLPGVFGTTLATVPAPVAYLAPDAARVARWKPRLQGDGKLTVGLVWAGNPAHARDRYRSLPLARLAPLAQVEGVRFFALQKGSGEQEAAFPPAGFDLVNLGPELRDFVDTAAVVSELDLVICVDTSVGHLAGALGKPVWMLIPEPADWRWLAQREDTPWYPTMRLFRQRHRGEWDDVIDRVRDALAEHVVRHASGGSAEAVRTVAPAVPPRPADRADAPVSSAVAETRHGIVQYLPRQPDVGVAIGRYGEVLQRQVDLVAQLLAPGAVIVECDAGVGVHALALCRVAGPDGHVLLYEPDPRARQILQHNLGANRIANATLMRGTPGAHGRLGEGTESIDDLHLPRLDLIKLGDGARVAAVVGGAERALWERRPLVFAAAATAADVAAHARLLEPYGYLRWRMKCPWFSPRNFNRRDDDAFGGRCAWALLAVPEEARVEIALDDCEALA